METIKYKIEIARIPKMVLISAVNVANAQENYLIELEKDKADLIIKEFNCDMNSIA